MRLREIEIETVSPRLFWMMSPTAGAWALMSNPWNTPLRCGVLNRLVTKTEVPLQLEFRLCCPGLLNAPRNKDSRPRHCGTTFKREPNSLRPLLISLQSTGSASFVNLEFSMLRLSDLGEFPAMLRV